MATTQIIPQTGITISTSITAGGWSLNHAEGIALSTALKAGGMRVNHGEGIVVCPATSGSRSARPCAS